MTLLSLCNDAQDIVGIGRATGIVGSSSSTARRTLALANQEGLELSRRHPWEALLTEDTFTSTATETQSGVFNADFDRIVNDSMYNRTRFRRVTGPLNAREWQAQKGITASVLTDSFRIRGGDLLLTPTPNAGDTYAFEYVSKNWCESSGGTGQSEWAADDDVGVLDESLMLLGLIWRLRQSFGQSYEEQFNTYERQVTQAMMRDGGKRVLNYSTDTSLTDDAQPPTIPEGSWTL